MINQVLICKRMEQFTEYLFAKQDQVTNSGLFVLLKQKIRLGREVILRLVNGVIEGFRRLVYGLVRS